MPKRLPADRRRALEHLPDAELLKRTVRDAEAFGIFYERHADVVLSYVAYRVREPETTFDIVAEVFAAALAGSARYRADRAPALAWLFGIVNNMLAGEYHRRGRERSIGERLGMARLEYEDDALAEAEAAIDAARAGFMQRLEELSPAERAAVRARVIEERDYADIAAAAGTTEDNMRQRVRRALAKLARLDRRER